MDVFVGLFADALVVFAFLAFAHAGVFHEIPLVAAAAFAPAPAGVNSPQIWHHTEETGGLMGEEA